MRLLKKSADRCIVPPLAAAMLVLALSLLVLPGLAAAATYYVSPTGNDANNGLTPATAWKTITHAAATVPAGTAAAPNVISVAAGTYNAANGETFPITFAGHFVSLTGAGSASTIIDAQNLSDDGLQVNARGFSVSGFTFRNMNIAISITEGGFNIHHNVFAATVSDGVDFVRTETDRAANIAFAAMAVTNNTFRTTRYGVYVSVEIGFDDTNRTASFGNFTIANNNFPLTGGDGIYISSLFNPKYITGGTVTVGNLAITGNTVTGGNTGIYFWSGVYSMTDAQVTVGNVLLSNNTCTNQISYGLYLCNWEIQHFYGTSNAVFGDFTVSGNTVTATDYSTYSTTYGIYLYNMDYIGYIYDETAINTGAITVSNNIVDVAQYGFYFYSYGIWYIGESGGGDSVAVTTGPRAITGNTVNSNDSYGMYVDLEYIGYDMYGTSTVDYGNVSISSNTITSYYEALYFYSWYEAAYYMYEDASAVLGSITVNDNTLTSSNDDAFYYMFEYSGYEMYGNSAATLGPTSIRNNTLNAGSGYGMYFYFYEIAYYMYDDAAYTVGSFTIDDNTINATGGNGIYIEYYDYYVGSYLVGNATATLPGWTITNNTIDVTGGYNGVEFYTYSNPDDNDDSATVHYGGMLIDGNTFNPNKNGGMDYGIYLYYEDVVETAIGPTTTTFGNITITGNTLYAVDSEAIYIEYDDVGYWFDDAATLNMGDIEISSNTIDTAPIGIEVYFYNLYTNDSAKVAIGTVDILDNTLTNISGTGITAYYYSNNEDPGTATLTIGPPTISGNEISGAAATGDGIYLNVDNATDGITFGMPTLSGNTVSGFNKGGIYLKGLPEATIKCNYLENNVLAGMHFDTAGTGFAVNYNSLVDNGIGLSVGNGYAAVINAEENWWGDKLGPAACASCNGVDPGDIGAVEFTPWLTDPSLKAYCGPSFPWLMFMPAITGMGK
jgi:hypothetical protein